MDKPGFTIGRSPHCDFVLESGTVSSVHAELRVDPSGRLRLLDRGSTNGTAVIRNGRAVDVDETDVSLVDVVRFGTVELPVSALVEALVPEYLAAVDEPTVRMTTDFSRAELESDYELLDCVWSGDLESYHALGPAGDVVMVHFLGTTAAGQRVQRMIDELPADANAGIRAHLTVDGAPVVVTRFIKDFRGMERWIELEARVWRADSADDRPRTPHEPPEPEGQAPPPDEDSAPAHAADPDPDREHEPQGDPEADPPNKPGEFTRLFRMGGSCPPGGAADVPDDEPKGADRTPMPDASPGSSEFSQLFRPPPPSSGDDPAAADTPPSTPVGPDIGPPSRTSGSEGATDGPGEFTRMFRVSGAGKDRRTDRPGVDPSGPRAPSNLVGGGSADAPQHPSAERDWMEAFEGRASAEPKAENESRPDSDEPGPEHREGAPFSGADLLDRVRRAESDHPPPDHEAAEPRRPGPLPEPYVGSDGLPAGPSPYTQVFKAVGRRAGAAWSRPPKKPDPDPPHGKSVAESGARPGGEPARPSWLYPLLLAILVAATIVFITMVARFGASSGPDPTDTDVETLSRPPGAG